VASWFDVCILLLAIKFMAKEAAAKGKSAAVIFKNSAFKEQQRPPSWRPFCFSSFLH